MTVEHPRGAGRTIDRAHANAEADRFDAELRPLIPTGLRLAAAMRLDPQDAEDAVQTAALRAWQRRANRRPDTDLRPWFLAIVANQCRETRRGRWASVLRFAEPPASEAPAGDTAGALDVISALRRVPPRVRLALVLRFYLDLPFDEVASISGCSVDAAKSRVRRGIESLKSSLDVPEDMR
jgi:RNA polymerase sigma-70 factor (ECF subfamily)